MAVLLKLGLLYNILAEIVRVARIFIISPNWQSPFNLKFVSLMFHKYYKVSWFSLTAVIIFMILNFPITPIICSIYIHSAITDWRRCIRRIKMPDAVLAIV